MATKALETTYEDVRKLVYYTAKQVWLRCGGDLREMESEAHELFVHAYNTHDSSKSSFTAWVALVIYRGLMQTRRTELKRASILGECMDASYVGEEEPEFNLDLFLSELSEDAEMVVGLLLETDNQSKKKLTRCLRGLGWSLARIMECFSEITHVLTSGD